METKESLIYILTNPSFPNYIKIGKTTNLKQRLQTLNSSTAIPFSFRVYAIYRVDINELDMVEKSIHAIIDKIDDSLRAREETKTGRLREREFFALAAKDAYDIFLEIAKLRKDVENVQKIEQSIKEKEEEKLAQIVEQRAKKLKAMTFAEYGIAIGERLHFTKDENIVVTVIGDKEVEYQGEGYSLSRLAGILLEEKYGWTNAKVQGPAYFMYKGKTLVEIKEEILKKKAELEEELENL